MSCERGGNYNQEVFLTHIFERLGSCWSIRTPGLQLGIMKTLSLVDCLELKFSGSILKEAVCFGDVDNDGVSELVVGNSDGELFIYKYDKCICRAFDLGCISAVAVGDLLNVKKNSTVVITTEGYCHIFDVEDELRSNFEMAGGTSPIGSVQFNDCRVIQQFHSQRIVANTKAIFLADVDDDGLIELVCGLTDRVLRTYKWIADTITDSESSQGLPSVSFSLSSYDGKIQAINKWELTNQIGSIAPHSQASLVSIIIGTGGGTVTRITEVSDASRCALSHDVATSFANSEMYGSVGCRLETQETLERELPLGSGHSVLQHPPTYSANISIKRHALNSSRMRNQNISTHVAGNIASHDGLDLDSYAVGTWDGTVMICKDDNIEWNLQLNKPVMTVQSFSGSAVFVDMEGPTYLINRRMDSNMQNCVLRFYFEQQVAAFRVGWYGMQLRNGESNNALVNQKCFVYVTFQGDIYIYPNAFL